MPFRAALAALLSLSVMFLLGLTDAMVLFPEQTDNPPLGERDNPPLGPRDASLCKLRGLQTVRFSSGFGYFGYRSASCSRTTGIVTGFMMFVDFPDAPQGENSAKDASDFFLPDGQNWYHYASYGKMTLDIKADMKTFYRMPKSSDSYQLGRGQGTIPRIRAFINDALFAYTSNGQRVPSTDILYIVTTISAKSMSQSVSFLDQIAYRDDFIALRTVVLSLDAFWVGGYMTFVHETGHTMCLADLYPSNGAPRGTYVGGWGLMGNEFGPSPDIFAWDKWRLGWLADEQIACVAAKGSSRHVLSPLYSEGPGLKAVVIARDKTTALVAEYRLNGGIDAATCSPGLLLYTVNTTIFTGGGPIRVIDANPNTNGCDNEPLNDATLSISRTWYMNVPDWGVTVEILSQNSTSMTIAVLYNP